MPDRAGRPGGGTSVPRFHAQGGLPEGVGAPHGGIGQVARHLGGRAEEQVAGEQRSAGPQQPVEVADDVRGRGEAVGERQVVAAGVESGQDAFRRAVQEGQPCAVSAPVDLGAGEPDVVGVRLDRVHPGVRYGLCPRQGRASECRAHLHDPPRSDGRRHRRGERPLSVRVRPAPVRTPVPACATSSRSPDRHRPVRAGPGLSRSPVPAASGASGFRDGRLLPTTSGQPPHRPGPDRGTARPGACLPPSGPRRSPRSSRSGCSTVRPALYSLPPLHATEAKCVAVQACCAFRRPSSVP